MTTRVKTPHSRCLASVARGDITPPVGAYHRMWGAAVHDRSTGVHRPLTATVLYLASPRADDMFRVVVALDHCLLRPAEFRDVLDRAATEGRLPAERFTFFFSHTHAAGLMGYERRPLPGGDQIGPYLERLGLELGRLARQASQSAQPATIVYGSARCDLATNRDYYDADRRQYVCGYNPRGAADDTVLLARVAADAGQPLATVVNYACHPTTLAWENTLVSPDYVGAMRELVEQATGAPCLFVQGASGDIGPREGFVGDVAVADRNGRQLGYAILGGLETLSCENLGYEYMGPVISGATLGVWKHVHTDDRPRDDRREWCECEFVVPLAYRPDLPPADALQRQRLEWERDEAAAKAAGDPVRARDARAMIERTARAALRIAHLPPGDHYPYVVRMWRLGDAVWLALSGEHYNLLQRELRRRFPETPIVVGTIADAYDVSYLLDRDSFGKGLYQDEVSILAHGALETLIDAIAERVATILDPR